MNRMGNAIPLSFSLFRDNRKKAVMPEKNSKEVKMNRKKSGLPIGNNIVE